LHDLPVDGAGKVMLGASAVEDLRPYIAPAGRP